MPSQKITHIITDADSFAKAEAQSYAKTLLVIDVCRDDIILGHTGSVIERLHLLTDQEVRVRRYRDSVVFRISGFDDDHRELPEIEQARKFFRSICEQFPFLLWFMVRGQGALPLLFSLLCEVKVHRNPQKPGEFGTEFVSIDEVQNTFRNLAHNTVPMLKHFGLTDQFDSMLSSALSDLFGPAK